MHKSNVPSGPMGHRQSVSPHVQRTAGNQAVRSTPPSADCWESSSPFHPAFSGLLGIQQSVSPRVKCTVWWLKSILGVLLGFKPYIRLNGAIALLSWSRHCCSFVCTVSFVPVIHSNVKWSMWPSRSLVMIVCVFFVDSQIHHANMSWLMYDAHVRTRSSRLTMRTGQRLHCTRSQLHHCHHLMP